MLQSVASEFSKSGNKSYYDNIKVVDAAPFKPKAF
jgi:hypothetical protein